MDGKLNHVIVGQALRHNPFAPEIPCHRVLKSDYSIGGYFGESGSTSKRVQHKKTLLEGEGLNFNGKGILDEEHQSRCVTKYSL
jgi:methylated-DNA-[protein]-cysteine S-methyltransferase